MLYFLYARFRIWLIIRLYSYKLRGDKVVNKSSSFFYSFYCIYKKELKRNKGSLNLNYFKIYVLAKLTHGGIALTDKLLDRLEKNLGYKLSKIDEFFFYEKDNGRQLDYLKLKKDKVFVSELLNFRRVYLIKPIITKSIVIFAIFIGLILTTYSFFGNNKLDVDNSEVVLNQTQINADLGSGDDELTNNNTDLEESANSDEINESTEGKEELSEEAEEISGETEDEEPENEVEEESEETNEEEEEDTKYMTGDVLVETEELGEESTEESNSSSGAFVLLEDIIKGYSIKEDNKISREGNDLMSSVSMMKALFAHNKFIGTFLSLALGFSLLFGAIILTVFVFKKHIIFYMLFLVGINFSFFYYEIGHVVGNLWFTLIILLGSVLYLYDMLGNIISISGNKTILKLYYYTRSFLFIVFVIGTIIYFGLYIISMLNLRTFGSTSIYMTYITSSENIGLIDSAIFLSILTFLSSVFIRILYQNIYYNIREIFNKDIKNNFDTKKLSKLIKKGTDKEIYRFFLDNQKQIEYIKQYLMHFLYSDGFIEKKHIKYLFGYIDYNDSSSIITDCNLDLRYSESYLSDKLERVKSDKKYKFSVNSGFLKNISYLDKGDQNSPITEVNVKKSLRTGKIIINVYEGDNDYTNVENLSINVVELLREKNLAIFKRILLEISQKKLNIKRVYIYNGRKLEGSLKFSGSKNLIMEIEKVITNVELVGKLMLVPSFLKSKINLKNLELAFNIAFDKIEVPRNYVDKKKIEKKKNNLLLGF